MQSDTALAVNARYGTTAKTLHWLIVLLLVVQYITAWLMPHIGRKTQMSPMIMAHFSFGLIILVLMALRLVNRLRHPVPLSATWYGQWERWLARATHLTFYFVLLVGPFLGWAAASSHSLPVSVFEIIPLPDLAAPRTRWANIAGDVHTYAMWTLLALLVLHAAAALFHYWFRRDRVLQSMLPGSA